MQKEQYNLNNPMERARIIIDSLNNFKCKKVILMAPASLTYTFNNIVEALEFIFYHTQEVDYRGTFLEAHITERPCNVYIRSDYGSYTIKKLSDFEYKYDPNEDERFVSDEKFKIELMEREFNSQFTTNELEDRMTNQALDMLNDSNMHTMIEHKLEQFLNRYFNGQWLSYCVESRQLDAISTQYTLRVKYNSGETIELNKPQISLKKK
jgi:hypothetical protein